MVWHWDIKGQSLEVGGADESKKPGAWPAYQAEYLRTRLQEHTDHYNAGSLVDEEKEVFLHNAAKNFEAEADEALKAEFQSWLKGSHEINFSRPEQRRYLNGSGKTPRLNTYRVDPSGAVRDPLELKDDWEHTSWGNKPLTNLPGVRDYLENIEKKKQSAHLNLNLLAEHGPSNLEEAWQYFKTWVKARPTSDSLPLHRDHGPDLVHRPAGPMDWGAPRAVAPDFIEDTNIHKSTRDGGIDKVGPLPFMGRPYHHEDVPVTRNMDSEVGERILKDPRSLEPGFSEQVWGEYAAQLFNRKELHTYAGYASGNDPVAERDAFIKAHRDNPNFAELFRRWQYGVNVFESDDDDLESVPSLSEDDDLGLDEDDYEEMADDAPHQPLHAWIAALNETADSPGFVDLLFDGPPYKNQPGGTYMNYHQHGVDPNNPERDRTKYKPEQDEAAGHTAGIWLKMVAGHYNQLLQKGVAPDDKRVYMLWKSYALNANYIWKRLAGVETLSVETPSWVLDLVKTRREFKELSKRPFIPDGTMPEYDLFHVPIPAGVDLTNMSHASFKQFVKSGYIPTSLPAD